MSASFFKKTYDLKDLESTKSLAQDMAKALKNKDLLLLEGDLGAGKTTFTRFLIQAITQKDLAVTSPTFTLVQTYEGPTYPIWHFDLYRMEDPEELFEAGFEEAQSHGLIIMEWPSRGGNLIPKDHLKIHFSVDQTHGRCAKLEPSGNWTERLSFE